MNRVESSKPNAKGKIQNDRLFILGNAISGAPTIIGTSQFASPTNAGMMAPKTMINPWLVVIWLKNSGLTNCNPGWNNSARMTNAMQPPIKNMRKLNHRYIVPMSLWLVVNSHRAMPFAGPW